MKLGITSIQRNRNPWIVEWLAFHMLVGFDNFYIYAHKCTDGMVDSLLKLSQHYPIQVHTIDLDDKPQLASYQHSWNTYGAAIDWMAFIDGDEFLFPTQHRTMADALALLESLNHNLSALAVYWLCYGSSGHIREPEGLVMENYPRHSSIDFPPNRHVKSIVRGGQEIIVRHSHVFTTPYGTFDERLRPVDQGLMRNYEPSYNLFRINHYAIQSYEFFKMVKQNMGAADVSPHLIRSDEWFFEHDRNECDDGISYNFLIRLKLKVRELQRAIAN